MNKKLIFLISTKGKSKEQIKKETREAYQKYQKINNESMRKVIEE